jgi:Peptidase M15
MTDLTRAQAKTILYNLGWRVNTSARLTQAIKDFQAGWNLGPALKVDGLVGPATSAAMRTSEARRRAGRTTASANFSFRTVRCRCDGRYASCRRIFQKRKAFQMMEKYRLHAGAFSVVSACRCPSRNRAIGGSPTSRHVSGLACDVPATYRPSTVKSWHLATNIGYGSVSGRVKHIDMGSGSVWDPNIYKDGR